MVGISGEGSKWNGPNQSNMDPEHTTNNWSTSQHTKAPLVKKQTIHIIPCHRDYATGDSPSSTPSQEWQGEPLESPKRVNPRSSSHRYGIQPRAAIVSPSHQEERQKLPFDTKISPHTQCRYLNNDKGGAAKAALPCAPFAHYSIESLKIRGGACYTTVPQEVKRHQLNMDAVYSSYQIEASPQNIGDCRLSQNKHKRRQTTVTICICNRTQLTRERKVSRAQQQHTLLRRCFYPRRDVIKWDEVTL